MLKDILSTVMKCCGLLIQAHGNRTLGHCTQALCAVFPTVIRSAAILRIRAMATGCTVFASQASLFYSIMVSKYRELDACDFPVYHNGVHFWYIIFV